MELNDFAKHNPSLHRLLQQSRYFMALDNQIKTLFPKNLASNFNVACVNNGTLVLMAKNGMVASRLKMMLPMLLQAIQEFDEAIADVKVRVLPENPVPIREKNFHLNETVLANFEQTAQKLTDHPELAQAIHNLVARRR